MLSLAQVANTGFVSPLISPAATRHGRSVTMAADATSAIQANIDALQQDMEIMRLKAQFAEAQVKGFGLYESQTRHVSHDSHCSNLQVKAAEASSAVQSSLQQMGSAMAEPAEAVIEPVKAAVEASVAAEPSTAAEAAEIAFADHASVIEELLSKAAEASSAVQSSLQQEQSSPAGSFQLPTFELPTFGLPTRLPSLEQLWAEGYELPTDVALPTALPTALPGLPLELAIPLARWAEILTDLSGTRQRSPTRRTLASHHTPAPSAKQGCSSHLLVRHLLLSLLLSLGKMKYAGRGRTGHAVSSTTRGDAAGGMKGREIRLVLISGSELRSSPWFLMMR